MQHMHIQKPTIKDSALDDVRDSSPGLSSGPGAIMFEPGPNTRIRRAPVRAIATMTWNGGPREVFAQVLNISPGGCLIKTETTIIPGTVLDLSILIVGKGERANTEIKATVRHETVHEGRRAYGVEFVRVSSEEKEQAQVLYGQAMGH